MKDLAPASVLVQEGKYLQRCSQRVALARGQEQDIAGKSGKDLLEKPLGASGSDENDIQVTLSVSGKAVAPEIEFATQFFYG